MLGLRRPSEVRLLEKMALGQVATGISGENLALYVLGLKPLYDHKKPLDSSDFDRCMKLYHASPRHLQRKMRPILDSWALGIREYYRQKIEENQAAGYHVGPWMRAQVGVTPNYR